MRVKRNKDWEDLIQQPRTKQLEMIASSGDEDFSVVDHVLQSNANSSDVDDVAMAPLDDDVGVRDDGEGGDEGGGGGGAEWWVQIKPRRLDRAHNVSVDT